MGSKKKERKKARHNAQFADHRQYRAKQTVAQCNRNMQGIRHRCSTNRIAEEIGDKMGDECGDKKARDALGLTPDS